MKTRLDFIAIKKLLFGANFSVSENRSLQEAMAKHANDYEFDPHDFTAQQLLGFGCRYWDEELILLLPWMVQFLPTGVELLDINNKSVIVGQDELVIDLETRAGVIAFGMNVSKLKQEPKPETEQE